MLYFTLLSNLLNNQCGTLCHAGFEHQEGEMYFFILKYLARFSSVAQSCLTLCIKAILLKNQQGKLQHFTKLKKFLSYHFGKFLTWMSATETVC